MGESNREQPDNVQTILERHASARQAMSILPRVWKTVDAIKASMSSDEFSHYQQLMLASESAKLVCQMALIEMVASSLELPEVRNACKR